MVSFCFILHCFWYTLLLSQFLQTYAHRYTYIYERGGKRYFCNRLDIYNCVSYIEKLRVTESECERET